MEDPFYSFVFRGLLTEEALDKAGRNNKVNSNSNLDESMIKRLPFELFDEEFVNQSNRMATVYAAISSFENSVRKFVSSKLMEEYGEEWEKEGLTYNIKTRAETRQTEESKIKWHSSRGENLINYIDFGDLVSIIINNWDLFEPHLQTQDWVSSILKPIEQSRNVLMHSGELGKQDIERLGTLMRDWITQVGA